MERELYVEIDEEEINELQKQAENLKDEIRSNPKVAEHVQKQNRTLVRTMTALKRLKKRKKHHVSKEDKYEKALKPGFDEDSLGTKYIPLETLFPAQCRYSALNVTEKIEKVIRRKGAVWEVKKKDLRGKWQPKWHHNTSAFPPVKAFPVIKSSWGHVLIDGHHHVLAGIALGSTSIPVKIVDDYSDLDKKTFWKKMQNKNYAHLFDLRGNEREPPKSFSELEKDANRYMALLLCRKYELDEQNEKHPDGKGAKYPVWLKIGKDIPFVEFVIADILWKKGIVYDPKYGRDLPEDLVEKIRKVVVEAKVPGLKVVAKRTHKKKIELKEYIEKAKKELEAKKNDL